LVVGDWWDKLGVENVLPLWEDIWEFHEEEFGVFVGC